MLSINHTIIRTVTKDDSQLILSIRNDKELRKFSFNDKKISKQAHKRWFDKMISEENNIHLILEYNSKTAGLIRLDILNIDKKSALVGIIVIVKEFRGKGLGKILFNEAIKKLRETFPNIKSIKAYVLTTNVKSMNYFLALGFKNKKSVLRKGKSAIEYELTNI